MLFCVPGNTMTAGPVGVVAQPARTAAAVKGMKSERKLVMMLSTGYCDGATDLGAVLGPVGGTTVIQSFEQFWM